MIYNPNILLTLSSSTFLFSSLYGLFKNNDLYRIDTVSALSCLVYWIDPENTNKKAVNAIIFNFVGLRFLLQGYIFLTPRWKQLMYFSTGGIGSSLLMSCISYKLKYSKWHYFHFLFHIFVTANKIIVYNL